MTAHPHDHIVPFKDSGSAKKQQVGAMFDKIADRYDFLNRFLTAGIDTGWRKKAIKELRKVDPKIILDVATGTAEMAILAGKLLKPEKIIGIDISGQMLSIGRKKVEKEGFTELIELQAGDSETINYAENTFDAVMVAFGVRNFENLEKGLRNMLSVLRPGGMIVILECSKPGRKTVRSLYNLYLGFVAPQVARLFKQNKEAYQYLYESVLAFPDKRQFVDILTKVGFSDTRCKSLSLGICSIYTGRKEGN